MTTKIVINKSFGRFELSKIALGWLMAKGIKDVRELSKWEFGDVPRHNKLLVELVEELGENANAGSHADLVVCEVETPSGRYYVNEYDGAEWITTPETIDWVTV